MKRKRPPKEQQDRPMPLTIKVGEYHAMFRVGLLWIIPFTLSIVISSMMGRHRYAAFFTVTASVWGLSLRHLSKRMVEMRITDLSIAVGDGVLPWQDIEHYYTCLPLRKSFMLRLQTKDGKRHIYYIPIEHRDEVESHISKRVCRSKQRYDGLLCCSHYIFLLIAMCFALICILLISHYNLF